MRQFWAAILMVAAVPLAAGGGVKWEESYAAAVKRAKAEKKLILMDIWTEWCPPCQHLKKNVFPTPEAQAALARFVPLSALAQKQDGTPIKEGTALAERFNIEGFPTLVILDGQGKEVRRRAGGFNSGREFAAWLAAQ